MAGNIKIGILALQGAFAKHASILKQLGVESFEVRTPQDLLCCHGLILPGGESTVMTRQLIENDLLQPLLHFSKTRPVFGTCAGLILMSQNGPLKILDLSIERNGFGRQKDSFSTSLFLSLSQPTQVQAFFIRAPRIKSYSSTISILGTLEGEPVCVQQGIHLASTFHPELVNSYCLHKYYLQLVKGQTTSFC